MSNVQVAHLCIPVIQAPSDAIESRGSQKEPGNSGRLATFAHGAEEGLKRPPARMPSDEESGGFCAIEVPPRSRCCPRGPFTADLFPCRSFSLPPPPALFHVFRLRRKTNRLPSIGAMWSLRRSDLVIFLCSIDSKVCGREQLGYSCR